MPGPHSRQWGAMDGAGDTHPGPTAPPLLHFLCGGGGGGGGVSGGTRASGAPFPPWGGARRHPGGVGAMAGLKTASGEAIDGSFELQVEVEEGDAVGQAGPTAGTHGGPTAAPLRTLALRVTGDLHVGGLMLLIVETIGERPAAATHGGMGGLAFGPHISAP